MLQECSKNLSNVTSQKSEIEKSSSNANLAMRAFESEASDKIFWDNDEEKTVHEMPKPEDPTLQHCKSAVQNIPQVYLVPGCILVENHSQNCFEITSESARVLIVRSEKRTEKKENPHGHVQVNLRRTCPKLMSNI